MFVFMLIRFVHRPQRWKTRVLACQGRQPSRLSSSIGKQPDERALFASFAAFAPFVITLILEDGTSSRMSVIKEAAAPMNHLRASSDRGTPGGDPIDRKTIVAALKKTGYKGDVVIARAVAISRTIESSRNGIGVKGPASLKKFFGKK
jgi:hypothetical protein